MACFVAPAATAIISTAIRKKVPEKYHFDWLLLILWGGTAMSITDHIINGEIAPYFPFFTKGWSQIWPEILKVGIPMALSAILLWLILVGISLLSDNKKTKLSQKPVW